MAEPPAGTAAFLAAEIVIDSSAASGDPAERAQLGQRVAAYIRQQVQASDGQVLSRSDGGIWAAYDQPIAAVVAAGTVATAIHAEHAAGALAGVRVGIGLHVGSPEDVDGEIQGPAITYLGHLLRASTRSGWIVMSQALWQLVREHLPPSLRLRGRSMMTPRDGSDPSIVYVLETTPHSTSTARIPHSQPVPHAIARKRPARAVPPRQRAGTPPEPFRIYTLGRFRVERGGINLELSTSQPQNALQLFKCLLSRPPSRRMPRDQAYEMFWPGSEAASTFRTNIKRLRDVLEPDVDVRASILQFTQEIINIRPETEIWIDADEFERLVIKARHSEAPDALLEDADRLWVGPFLPDDVFHDWSDPRRAELRRLWTELQFELARRREQRGDEHGAEEALLRLLADDPTDEQAARELMILQTRHGRRSDTFKVYQRLEEALAHLDKQMEPAPETQALRQRIAAGEIERGQSPPVDPTWLPFPLPLPPSSSPGVAPEAGQPPAETSPATASEQPARKSQLVQATNPDGQAGPDSQPASVDTKRPGSQPDNPTTWPPLPEPSPEAESFTPTYPFPMPGELIGRQADLVSARQVLERGLSGGQMLLIGAAAGTGKSALAGLIVAEARNMGFLCLAGGSFDQDSPSPYAPIRDALCDYLLAQPPEQLGAELGHLVTDLVPIVPELRYHLGEGGELPPDTPEPARLLAAVHGCLRELAFRRPTLLCLEDLHAVDGPTLDMLHYLARQTLRLRLVFVGTFRPEEVQPGRPLARLLSAASRDGSAQVLRLAQLTRDETQALIAERLSGPVSETLTDTLFAVTEGNPLFIEQLALALREESHIVQRDGVWHQVDGDAASMAALPPIVESVIERRFDRLPPGGRGALAMAAVLGQTFELQTLLAALAPDDQGAVAVLDNAREAQLLHDTPTGYRFGHAMIREVLYRRLSGPRRALLHARAGAVIEEAAGERADERAAELAHHFALAASVAPTAEKALRFCLLAGKQAAALSSHREALRHYNRAFDLLSVRGAQDGLSLEARSAQEIEVHQGRGAAEWNLWRWEPLIADFQRVLELTDDPVRRGLARSAIGFARQQRGDTAAAMAEYAAALDELEAAPDRQDAVVPRFRVRVEQAYVAFLQGRYGDMLQLGEKIMQDALPLDQPLLTFWAHNVQALAYMGSGNVAQSMRQAEIGCAVAAQTGDALRLAVAEANFGVVCCFAGKYAAALPHLDRAVSLYRESAAGHRAANAIHWLGRVALANGDLRLAAEHAEHARALAVEGEDRWIADCHDLQGMILLLRAEWQPAQECFELALRGRARVDHQGGRVESLVGLGMVQQQQGRWTDARASLEQAVHLATSMDPSPFEILARRRLGRLLTLQGEPSAQEHLARALQLAQTMPESAEYAPTLLALADLNWQDEPLAERVRLAEAAHAAASTVEDRIVAQLVLAGLTLATGNTESAEQLAATATAQATPLQAPRVLGLSLLAQGQVRAAQADMPAALDALDAAITTLTAAGLPFERACAMLAQASVLAHVPDHALRAGALRSEAQQVLKDLGARPERWPAHAWQSPRLTQQ